MNLTNSTYIPALRWRQGEYQALSRLTDVAKDRIVPLITIPDVEFDFETNAPKKSVHEHVHPFATRYKAKWGSRPAWIGVHKNIIEKPMNDGRDIFSYIFEALRNNQANAVPAITLNVDAAIVKAVSAIIQKDTQGVAILVRMEDLMKSDAKARVMALMKSLKVSFNDVDIILDLGAPNFEPYTSFAGALVASLQRLGNVNAFRNLVLIATAIPITFKDIAKGLDHFPRHDWMFYEALIKKLPAGMRRPNYGDYTVVHPDFSPLDMRKIKSSGKIIYTTPTDWYVCKGGAFRDNPAQMHGHCKTIIEAGIFEGRSFSSGDEYIADCADKKVKPSNQSWWKCVTINHHITHVLADLAMLPSAP